jgi:hypothetical protein
MIPKRETEMSAKKAEGAEEVGEAGEANTRIRNNKRLYSLSSNNLSYLTRIKIILFSPLTLWAFLFAEFKSHQEVGNALWLSKF